MSALGIQECRHLVYVSVLRYSESMSINIKNPDAERAVRVLVAITGETQAEAIEIATSERAHRLQADSRHERIQRLVADIQHSVRVSVRTFDSEDLYDDAGLPA